MKHDPTLQIEECERVYQVREDSLLLLDCLDVGRNERMLEMGSATGIISVHCAKAGAIVTAADVNPYAVSCTRNNAERNGLEIDVLHSDLFLDVPGRFDVMVINPPYLPVEEKGDVEARGARIRFFAADGTPDGFVAAETCTYDRKMRRVHSTDAVQLERQGLMVSGTGLDWDAEKKMVCILGNVHVEINRTLAARRRRVAVVRGAIEEDAGAR